MSTADRVQKQDRRQMGVAWPSLDSARDVSIADVIGRSKRARPEKTALVFGDQRLTYLELDAAVRRVAAQLQAIGIRDGEFVVTLGRNSAHLIILYFALAHIGAVNVPLNPMLTTAEIVELVDRTRPAVFVHAPEFEETAAAVIEAGYDVREMPETLATLTADSWFHPFEGTLLNADLVPGGTRPGLVIFTSGSTAKPKGCVKSHLNMLWHSTNNRLSWSRTPNDVEYFCIPVSGVGFANFVLPVFAAGATLVIDRVTKGESAAVVERERATTTFLPATAAEMILMSEDAEGRDFSSLRIVQMSYRMSAGLRAALVERLGSVFYYGYGMTEGGMLCGAPETFLSKPTSHGRPDGVDEMIICDVDGRPAPVGERGEILIKGPSVMLGYLDDSEGTAVALRDGWLHTGDLGHIDEDGELHFDGRLKDIIKSGGLNVSSEEVELAVCTVPGVQDAAVIGVPDDHWGEAVRAVVVTAPEATWTEDDLIAEIRRSLAGYKTPKSIIFVDGLPRNPGGKLAKGKIIELYGGR